MILYNFAKEFNKAPGPRTEDIGPYSGRRFAEEVLIDLFENNTPIEIDASETVLNFGPSFLSEAFGKMAKKYGKEKFYSIIHINKEGKRNLKLTHLIQKHVDIALSK